MGRPQVAYRETIRRASRAEGKFIRQSGGRGQYGHVVLELSPAENGSGNQFEVAVVGGSVPREFFNAVRSGALEGLLNGVLAGYPVVDVKVVLVDGSSHDVDSSEIAFKIAASMGVKEGLRQGQSVLLEPIMSVEVLCPDSFTGPVIDDMNSRRGRITDIETRGSTQIVRGEAPLAQMFGYVNGLRSLTQGRATFSMQFGQYSPVPDSVAAELIQH